MSGVTDFYGFEFSSRSGASTELGRTQLVFKYVLIGVNCLFLVFGCVLVALGAYAVNSQAGALAGASLPKAIIALGVFTIVLSFLGCFASFFESRLALSIYFGVLLLICLLSFLIGIGVLVEKNESTSLLVQGWSNAGWTAQQALAEAIGCCGFYDYCDNCQCFTSAHQACKPTPAQCTNCVSPATRGNSSYTLSGWSCPAGSTSSSPVCLGVLQSSFDKYYQQAGGASIAFGVLMFAAMLLVCVLMRAIKQKAYLDSVRAQHKRIREAKEDDGAHAAITMAGIRTGLETELDTDQSYARATRRGATSDGGSGYAEVQLSATAARRGGTQRDDDDEGGTDERDEGQEDEEEEEEEEELEEEEEEEEEEVEEEEDEQEEEEVTPPPRRAGRAGAVPPRRPAAAAAPQRSKATRRGADDFS